MPLNKQINFKARLQNWSRIQGPKKDQLCYGLDPAQLLKVSINPQLVWSIPQTFHAKMRKDGRISIPKVILELLSSKPLPENCILEVTLDPA